VNERRPRILAVDDKPENIRLLEAVLAPAGYEVVGAGSGQEALAKAREESFDMILTDVVMPGMSGYELCRTLRKDPATAFLPIVTITASGGEEKKEALDAGADDYVAKPFDKTELLARVRSLLRVKRYHDDLQDALDRQTAIGEVLRTIGSSAFHLAPVLDAVAKHAARLCDAGDVIFWRTVGDSYVLAVEPRLSAESIKTVLDDRPIRIGPETIVGRAHLERRSIQVPDIAEYYRGATGRAADLARLGVMRTLLAVPLIRDDKVLGVMALARPEVRPFSDDEIDLVGTFADQAAIAIANVDLFETVERQRTELSRFLSPQIGELLTSEEGAKLLEGHRRAITVTFCDLRGFTAFAEMAEPEEVLGVLREYHGAMGELIVAHRGVLEHFAGDGFMVFFNDPVLLEHHELAAVRMAVAMRERFNELAAGWRKRGYELNFGVGIAVGYATLGRIGFEGRYDYGAVGNVVILASRLAAEAKGGQILLSQRMHAAVEASVDVEPVGDLTLKGISRPVPAVNVTALRGVPA
jgi:class 3 adenylate cyclase/CheY-like chemotaxis protein